MNLSFEELMLLASSHTMALAKSEIIYGTMSSLNNPKNDYSNLSSSLDSLVMRGLMEKDRNWGYKITTEGTKELKKSYSDLQIIMLKLYNVANG